MLESVANKQCALDPVPTWLVKQCADILVPAVITSVVNLTLSSATFHRSQKLARVLPLLKKPDMDMFDLKSYTAQFPSSNLTFISKLLERLVARRLLIHSELNQLLPRYQSAYRPHHSTETALTRVTNDILCSIDKGNVCAVVLLDLNAACLRHGGPWASAEHYIQQVWTSRSSSAVASVIPVRPHSDCQHQQSTVYAEHSVVRCVTKFGPGAGTIRHIYRGPWRVNHRLQCSTSLLC